MSSETLDRGLVLDAVRVTEIAAIAEQLSTSTATAPSSSAADRVPRNLIGKRVVSVN